jgi:O-antigen/teichoic acid export membrane protein
VLSYSAVNILLGDQWTAVAPVVRIVALAFLFSFSFELNYPVLVAVGGVRDIFLRALIVCPISAGIVTFAAQFGIMAVAWSMMIIVPLQAFVSLHFVRKHVGISWLDIFDAVRKSGITTAITVAGPFMLTLVFDTEFEKSPIFALMAACIALAGFLFAIRLTDHPILDEIRMLRLLAGSKTEKLHQMTNEVRSSL